MTLGVRTRVIIAQLQRQQEEWRSQSGQKLQKAKIYALTRFSTYRSLFRVQDEPSLFPIPDNLPSLVEVAFADFRCIWNVIAAVEEDGGSLSGPVGLLRTLITTTL